jgi:hypothetical protein
MAGIAGSRGRLLDKEIRAVVRMSEAGEVTLTTATTRHSLLTVFYTRDEARALVRALEDAMHEPMKDIEVPWGPERE